MGRTLVANRLLAGSACGKRQRGRPLNSVVRCQMGERGIYWRLINFLVRRVTAVGFIVVGSILVLEFLPALMDPAGTIPVNGVPESDLGFRLMGVAFPAIVVVLGVLLFRAKPFYPDTSNGE